MRPLNQDAKQALTRIPTCTAVCGITAFNIDACISGTRRAKRLGTRTAVLDAFAIHTHFARVTFCAQFQCAFSTTIGIVIFRIDALNARRRTRRTHIDEPSCALILTRARRTALYRRVDRFAAFTRIPARSAVCGITAFDIDARIPRTRRAKRLGTRTAVLNAFAIHTDFA